MQLRNGILNPVIALSLTTMSVLAMGLQGSLPAMAKDKGDFEKKSTNKHYPAPNVEQLSSLKPKQLKKLRFPLYDQGGAYWYHKGEYEKARQYWTTAMKMAEAEVPPERARGLSQATESATCSLIEHLMYLLRDVHYKPAYYSSQQATPLDTPQGVTKFSDPDPRKVQLYNLRGQMRGFQADLRYWEQLKGFSKRCLGEGHRCIYQPTQYMEVEFNYKIINTRDAIAHLENQLNDHSLDSQQTPWGGGQQNRQGNQNGLQNTNGQVENPWNP